MGPSQFDYAILGLIVFAAVMFYIRYSTLKKLDSFEAKLDQMLAEKENSHES